MRGSTTRLARGPAARPRCIPPTSGSFRALNPFQSHRSYRRSTTRGRLRSPCTHRSFQEDHGAIAPLGTTRKAWRLASPPAPNHARTSGRPITNQGSVPAPPDTPMTISWRRFHRDQEGSFRATLSLEPSHRAGAFVPLASLTNRAPFGCRHLVEDEPGSEDLSPPFVNIRFLMPSWHAKSG